MSWKTVIKRTRCGGLGLSAARMMNISLLGKLIWTLAHQREKLWVQILVAKDLNYGSIFSTKECRNASYVWQDIIKL